MPLLVEGGVTLAMGTDGGPPAWFQGYLEHLEMELMAEAGLSPRQVLVAATGDAASCLDLDGVGLLEPGRWADPVVLAEDPLGSIEATRSIESVRVAGNVVPGSSR